MGGGSSSSWSLAEQPCMSATSSSRLLSLKRPFLTPASVKQTSCEPSAPHSARITAEGSAHFWYRQKRCLHSVPRRSQRQAGRAC